MWRTNGALIEWHMSPIAHCQIPHRVFLIMIALSRTATFQLCFRLDNSLYYWLIISYITHWFLGDAVWIKIWGCSHSYRREICWAFPIKLSSGECQKSSLMISLYLTAQYLSQCWPGSMSPYGVTSLKLVKLLLSANIDLKRELC